MTARFTPGTVTVTTDTDNECPACGGLLRVRHEVTLTDAKVKGGQAKMRGKVRRVQLAHHCPSVRGEAGEPTVTLDADGLTVGGVTIPARSPKIVRHPPVGSGRVVSLGVMHETARNVLRTEAVVREAVAQMDRAMQEQEAAESSTMRGEPRPVLDEAARQKIAALAGRSMSASARKAADNGTKVAGSWNHDPSKVVGQVGRIVREAGCTPGTYTLVIDSEGVWTVRDTLLAPAVEQGDEAGHE